jgi:hypothetical protein
MLTDDNISVRLHLALNYTNHIAALCVLQVVVHHQLHLPSSELLTIFK